MHIHEEQPLYDVLRFLQSELEGVKGVCLMETLNESVKEK